MQNINMNDIDEVSKVLTEKLKGSMDKSFKMIFQSLEETLFYTIHSTLDGYLVKRDEARNEAKPKDEILPAVRHLEAVAEIISDKFLKSGAIENGKVIATKNGLKLWVVEILAEYIAKESQ